MGASRWTYFTPFRENEQEALDDLRDVVFERDGAYYREAGVETLAALAASGWLDEEAAHSVLDVSRAVRCTEGLEEPGDVRVLEAAEVVELFGSGRPGRAAVEQALTRAGDGWFPPVERGFGCCTAVYGDDGSPAGLCFWGLTGD
ncbi:hypothetical protein ACFVU3_11045 [Streptomyces sp. NPDC058052]|uniref:hypothetical protein n=1 Tax=Streptomyces sp. NPDC058052 TaxID=3346316 RepID=UPI0036EB82EE